MKVCSCSPQRQNKSILSFLAPPHQPASAKVMLDNNPWKSAAVGLLLLPPRLQTLLPSPGQVPPALYRQAWSSGSATGAETNGTGPDAACQSWICFPLLQSHVVMVYVLFVLRCFFLFSHCTPQWSIVWGLIFFPSSLSSCKCCIFLPFPVFLFCLPRCHVCCVGMNRLMANFAGTCD